MGFKGIWKKLKGNITEFLNEFKWCVFPESFLGVSKKLIGCFKEVLRVFQRSNMAIKGCRSHVLFIGMKLQCLSFP